MSSFQECAGGAKAKGILAEEASRTPCAASGVQGNTLSTVAARRAVMA